MNLFALFFFLLQPAPPTALVTAGFSGGVTVAWSDGTNPSGTLYNVYRAPGPCGSNPLPGPPIQTSVAPDVDDAGNPVPSYVDSNSSAGEYCYAVAAVIAGIESAQSRPATAYLAPPFPVSLSIK